MDKFQFFAALFSLLFAIVSNFADFKSKPSFIKNLKYIIPIFAFVGLIVWAKELAKFSTFFLLLAALSLIKIKQHGQQNMGLNNNKQD